MDSNNKHTSSSYIDLILTNQPNLIVHTQNAPPANCQNQITFAMASLRVAYPLALNVISGIMQKVVLME